MFNDYGPSILIKTLVPRSSVMRLLSYEVIHDGMMPSMTVFLMRDPGFRRSVIPTRCTMRVIIIIKQGSSFTFRYHGRRTCFPIVRESILIVLLLMGLMSSSPLVMRFRLHRASSHRMLSIVSHRLMLSSTRRVVILWLARRLFGFEPKVPPSW